MGEGERRDTTEPAGVEEGRGAGPVVVDDSERCVNRASHQASSRCRKSRVNRPYEGACVGQRVTGRWGPADPWVGSA
jgi:hypothetical protein